MRRIGEKEEERYMQNKQNDGANDQDKLAIMSKMTKSIQTARYIKYLTRMYLKKV